MGEETRTAGAYALQDPKNQEKLAKLAKLSELTEGEALASLIEAAPHEKLERPSGAAARSVESAPRSKEWAKLAGPFGWFIIGLTGFVFLAPFFGIIWIEGVEPMERINSLNTWATHVLAAVVGFTSTVLAYFFGKTSQ